jgi:hypothetical protein
VATSYRECEDRRENGGAVRGLLHATQKAGVTDTGGAVPREGKAMLHPVARALPPRSAAPGSGRAPKVGTGTGAGVAQAAGRV